VHWLLELNPCGPTMGRQGLGLLIVALMASLSITAVVTANTDTSYEPGFVEWTVVPQERLFVEGLDIEEAVLQRGQTDSAVGGFTVGATANPVPVFTLQSLPVQQAIETNVQMSVYFSAILEGVGGPQACTRQNIVPGDETTTLSYVVSIGGTEIYSSSVSQVIDTVTENDAMNFSGERQNVSLIMAPGDSFSLQLSVHHQCAGTQARVQWGGFEHNAGGIVMEGVIFEPEARIVVDSQRRAHVEFEHRLPWGLEDLREEKWEIWGPLEPSEKIVRDGEFLVETSAGRIRMERQLGDNLTVYTWSGAKTLPIGELALKMCMKTVAGDLNSDCHAEGIVRFEVTKGDEGFASAALVLTGTTILALLGYVITSFRSGLMLPVPILGALLVLALLTMPTVLSQPNLGADAVISDNTKVVDAELTASNGETIRISELLEGREALLIGLVLPGSEQVLTQANEFNRSLDQLGDRVSVIHIVTGEGALLSDAASMKGQSNVTWPVVLDADSAFARSLPTGPSDAVLVVDPAMHVTFSQGSSAAMLDLVEAVDDVKSGGPTSAAAYFALILGPGLFLLFLALPREEWVAPEDPLPPGLLWASTIVASGAGVLMVNLPAVVLALAPVGMTARFVLDLVMMAWLLEMCFFTARRGTPYEAEFLGAALHRLFPEGFRNWRNVIDMKRDTLLGVWLGWFGWLTFPHLYPQSVAATALTGGGGWAMAVFMLLLLTVSAGLVVLLLRIVASWGGPFSRLFGKFGGDVFAQFVGWVLTPMALWVSLNTLLNLMEIGVF